MMRSWVLVTLLLVVVPVTTPVADAWTQIHGGPDRSALLRLPDIPLDVTVYRTFLTEGENMGTLVGPNLVEAEGHLVGIARNNESGDCTMIKIARSGRGEIVRLPLSPCHSAWFQGYDPQTRAVIACNILGVGDPILVAWSFSDGRPLWSVVPTRDLGVVDDGGYLRWGCSGVAIDHERRELVVPFISARHGPDGVRHRIASIDLDTGGIDWATQVPAVSMATGALLPRQPVDGSGANFVPLSATLSTNGMAITGVVICPDFVTCDVPEARPDDQPAPFQTGVAWLTRDGQVQGMAHSRHDPRSPRPVEDLTRRTAGGAFIAAAQGALLAANLGAYVTIINPQTKDWIATTEVSNIERAEWGVDSLAPPVWSEESLFVPFYRTLTAFNPVDLSKKWAWATHDTGWLVQDLAVTATGNLLVLIGKTERSSMAAGGVQGDSGYLVRIDGDTGAELQRLPIRVETWMTSEKEISIPVIERGLFFPRPPVIVPVGSEGVAITDMRGHLVIMEPASGSGKDLIKVRDRFPGPGEPVALSIRPPSGTTRLYVQWGDGLLDTTSLETGPSQGIGFEHAYSRPQRYEILVTSVGHDGLTLTEKTVLDVGAARPPDLNLLQWAFAPQNQDTVWGVLGILLAVFGSLWAANHRLRARRRLAEALAEVDDIHAAHRSKPIECERTLLLQKDRLRSLLMRGHLTEPQYNIIIARVDEHLQDARRTVVGDDMGFLTPRLATTLVRMLTDGVTTAERDAFMDQVEKDDALSANEKGKVRRIVAAWAAHDG